MNKLSMRVRRKFTGLVSALLLCACVPARSSTAAADGTSRFRDTYQELVETNTTLSTGDCTLASQRMRARLLAAGYSDQDARVIVPQEFPKQGNLVARIAGSVPALPAVLLLAHIDTVEADRADWSRDPFTLVEENGYFYARGAIDDKAMAAAFIDALVRYRDEGFRPKRTIKLALTCGEENDEAVNGVRYLLATVPEALDAGWAVNEGGRGQLDAQGAPVSFGIQSGEKLYQDFLLVATSPGGHSARPTEDNAIDRLATALLRIREYRFPIAPTQVSKQFFGRSARLYAGQTRADLEAIGNGTADAAAFERIAGANPLWNAFLRTTCISTLIHGGHSLNAQPQRAEANVNCRIMPGETVQQIHQRLQDIVADPQISLTLRAPPGPQSGAPELTAQILAPVDRIVADLWPGVLVIPTISTGATDGRFLNAAGIPTFGISGVFVDPDGNGVHGLDERVRVRSLLDARTFLYRLVKAYANDRAAR